MNFNHLQLILFTFIIGCNGELLQMSSSRVNMSRVLRNVSATTITGCQMECSKETGCSSIGLQEGDGGSQLHTCYLLKADEGNNEGGEVVTIIEALGSGPRVNGQWGCWRDVSACTAKCEGGRINQTRDCDSPRPRNGGDNCAGLTHRTVICNTHKCPVNGGWGAWKNISECDAKCEGGRLNQTRDCDSPRPKHGGNTCTGDAQRTVACNTHECPVVNVALNKTATQSEAANEKSIASLGNDGDVNTFSITKSYVPKWSVDLGAEMKIEYIIFRGNEDSFKNGDYKYVDVYGRRNATGDSARCKYLGQLKQAVVRFSCDTDQKFRFIQMNMNFNRALYVNEFEVYVKQR